MFIFYKLDVNFYWINRKLITDYFINSFFILFKYKFKFVVSYISYAFEFCLNFTNFREGTRMNEDFETQESFSYHDSNLFHGNVFGKVIK